LTKPFCCSFVELVASCAQVPWWFVSHFWGTPFAQTVSLIAFHIAQRCLPAMTTPYWMCTFANNQHDLSELGTSLQETPFVKAILSRECRGTLTLMDESATTLERIWCVLESYVSTNWAKAKGSHLIDIAAWLPEGQGTYGGEPTPPKATLRMDLGQGRMKELVDKPETGGAFPLTVSNKGSKIEVFEAKASHSDDRKRILHLIAGTPPESWGNEPPETCKAYTEMNRNARRMFAPGAMYDAALRNDVPELQRLLSEHGNLQNAGIGDGATPLYAAAWKNNLPALEVLLGASANPNIVKEDGASPLFIAAQAGNADIMNVLIASKANVNQAGPGGQTPLLWASYLGLIDPVKALLDSNANPDHVADGSTPLGLAKKKGHDEVVRALIDAGATKDSVGGGSPSNRTLRRGRGSPKAFGNAFADAGLDITSLSATGGLLGGTATLYGDLF